MKQIFKCIFQISSMQDYHIPDILCCMAEKNLLKLRPVFGKSHIHNVLDFMKYWKWDIFLALFAL